MTGLIDMVFNGGIRALAVIDFNAAGTAAMDVAIGGQVYLEADAADAPNGVWTNGASAANSATSLNAAINGDTRSTKPKISSFLSDVGDSVIVVFDAAGSDGELALTSSDGTATVENMHDSEDNARMEMAMISYAVTAQDVLADEVNIVLPFTPTGFIVSWVDATGDELATPVTTLAAIVATPDRILLNFAGAADPVATDVVNVLAWRRAT